MLKTLSHQEKVISRGLIWIMAAVALFAPVGDVWSQSVRQPVETRLEARKVIVAADGKESFAGAEAARPGDVIEYVATYRNTSKDTVRNLEATLPIPANTELVAGSQVPGNARASLDSRTYAPLPLKRKEIRNGVETEQPVPFAEIRSLRWTAPTLPGEKSLAFVARVRILDERVTGPPGTQGGSR